MGLSLESLLIFIPPFSQGCVTLKRGRLREMGLIWKWISGLHLEDEGEGNKGEMIFHPELFGISFSGGEENRNFISSPEPSNQQHHAHGL